MSFATKSTLFLWQNATAQIQFTLSPTETGFVIAEADQPSSFKQRRALIIFLTPIHQ
jgi:hypothetical protein